MSAYLDDQMANDLEDQETRHREALAYYEAWIVDRERRHREYDARVDAYHARLAAARTARAEAGEQHDAHVGTREAWLKASRATEAAE